MNLNDIINETIAGLIVALICTCFGLLCKFIKKKHSENSELFWLYIRFIVNISGILAAFSLILNQSDLWPLWSYILMFVINCSGLFMLFNEAIHYNNDTTNHSDKS